MINFAKNDFLRKFGCAALVVIVTAVLLLMLSFLFYPKNNSKAFGLADEKSYGILGERANSIDVIFLGDSEAYSAFSPLQMWGDFGFTSYVCATSGQKLPFGYSLLRKATRNQKPRVVVIETNTAYRKTTVEDAFKRLLEDALPVFEYHNRWKTLTIDDIKSCISTSHTDKLKGFRIRKEVKKAKSKKHMSPSDKVAEICALNKVYLRAVVDHCRAIEAVPVFVSTPSTVNWSSARHNGIAELARELDVAYLDLNTGPTKVSINWKTDSADAGDHLNLAGAQKVSNYIGSYLSRFYRLEDHRNDKAYSSWNVCLTRYRGKIA